MKDKIDLFSQLSVYHENILKLSQAFKPLIEFIKAGDIDKAKIEFMKIYILEFVDHFNLEEKVIFPAVKVWSKEIKYRRIIDGYLQIHNTLRKKSGVIISKVIAKNCQFSKEQLQMLISEIEELREIVTEHAKNENTEIIPLLKNNSGLRFLSNRNLIVYRTFLRNMKSEKSEVKLLDQA